MGLITSFALFLCLLETKRMAKKKINIVKEGNFSNSQNVDDVLLDLDKELKGVSFDAHFVTQKIIEFGKLLTGTYLYRYQERIAYRIIYSVITFEGAIITILLSRQSGKSQTLAFVINSLSVLLPALAKVFPDLEPFGNGVKIGLFAPQSDQVNTTYNRALNMLGTENAEEVMADADLQVSLEKPYRYQLTNGSFMTGQVASKQSKIEGKTYDIVIEEESQDIDTYISEKSISPMVSSTGGTIIKCGTTGTQKNHYYQEIQFNRNKSRTIKDERLALHWEFSYKKIFEDRRFQYKIDGKQFHLLYEKDVQKKLERWGKDSQAFKLSYALEWDLESGMLFTDKELEKVLNRKKGLGNFNEDDYMIAGLDLGKEVDSTVLTIAKVIWPEREDEDAKKEVVAWIQLSGLDYEQQHHIIVGALQDYYVQGLCVDYTGVGKAFVDRLEYAVGDYISIQPFTFSKQSKSDMWFNLLDHRDSKRLVIPANKVAQATHEWQTFQEQILNCIKWYDGSYLCAEASDGFHDDYVDSLALMLMVTNEEVGPEIEIDDVNPMFQSIINNRNFRRSIEY